MFKLISLGVLLLAMSTQGCIVGEVYTKTWQAHDCTVDNHTWYCEKAHTDAEIRGCMRELQDWCIHEAAVGNLGDK